MKKILIVLTLLISCLGFRSETVFADTDDISNYQILEYIQSTGSQYINTGIDLSNITNLKIEADFKFSSVDNSSSHFLFGTGAYSSNTANRRLFGMGIWSSQGGGFKAVNNTTAGNGVYISSGYDTLQHTWVIDLSNNTAYLDNDSFVISNNGSMTSNSLIIFGARSIASSGSPVGYLSSGYLYSFKIYSSSTLLYNFVPVKRISDNEAGLFDTVNNVFYGNDGSGSFITGNEVFEIVTSVSPSGSGSVTGGGSYLNGETATLTATPNTGFVFSGWSDGNQNNPRTITVTSGLNITANFSPVSSTYTVTTNVSPSDSGTVSGSGTYDDGDLVTLEATPAEGYSFSHWNDGLTANPRSLTIHSDHTFTAYFVEISPDQIQISTSVSPSGSGYVTGGGYYDLNEEIELEAIPNTGYEFVSWNDESTDNPRTITVEEEATYIANFQLIDTPTPEVNSEAITTIIGLLFFLILVNMNKGGLI